MENSKIPVVSAIYYEEWSLSYYYGYAVTGHKKSFRSIRKPFYIC